MKNTDICLSCNGTGIDYDSDGRDFIWEVPCDHCDGVGYGGDNSGLPSKRYFNLVIKRYNERFKKSGKLLDINERWYDRRLKELWAEMTSEGRKIVDDIFSIR